MPARPRQKSKKGAPQAGTPGRNQPCPCGSGEKYKNCCGAAGRARRSALRPLVWAAAVVVAVLLALAVNRSGGEGGGSSTRLPTSATGYTERDLPEVDFSSLAGSAREKLLGEINRIFCTCGCGLTLAECVVTDSTCPLRNSNIQRIQEMVKRSGQEAPPEVPSG